MKSKLLLSTLLVLSLGGAAFAADKDETPLSKEMTQMNKSLRTVKRQLADASKKSENIELIEKVKKNLDEAKKLEPKNTGKQSDKAAYTTKYKDEMGTLAKTVDELESAIKADKADEAKKALDKIYQIKEKGHKDFGVDED
jgi:soluble cytochrome b562